MDKHLIVASSATQYKNYMYPLLGKHPTLSHKDFKWVSRLQDIMGFRGCPISYVGEYWKLDSKELNDIKDYAFMHNMNEVAL